jgi:hypothetical protein
LVILACFVTGVLTALFLWSRIALPYRNPYGIISPASIARFNPANNIVRFLILVTLPSILLFISHRLTLEGLRDYFSGLKTWSNRIEPGHTGTRQSRALLVFVLACTLLLVINLRSSIPPHFDGFHDGESLSASLSYSRGQAPNKGFVFVHGLFRDPGRAVLALLIFVYLSIAVVSFLVSTDRGLFLLAAALLSAPLVFIVFSKSKSDLAILGRQISFGSQQRS